ncbi:Hypothetical predicted protein [Marmota monax]|uniref:Uncharacterized protein n=1 Tax=Marmota monax TaxID=9995 RepID=A0A5E4BU66_MARMO|nr:hypothetical protein GHT09_019133 [Marmota monax]VTJ72459.1 Hypothetical predicted protein [Marmota monax]
MESEHSSSGGAGGRGWTQAGFRRQTADVSADCRWSGGGGRGRAAPHRAGGHGASLGPDRNCGGTPVKKWTSVCNHGISLLTITTCSL